MVTPEDATEMEPVENVVLYQHPRGGLPGWLSGADDLEGDVLPYVSAREAGDLGDRLRDDLSARGIPANPCGLGRALGR